MSKNNNDAGGHWIWILFLFGALCPFWVLVSRISKNILFDGMLYDNIMFLTYAATLIILGSGAKFSTYNWIGVGAVVFGSVLMRL